MEQKKIRGIIAQCISIKEQSNILLKKANDFYNYRSKMMGSSSVYSEKRKDVEERIKGIYNEVKALVDYYNNNIRNESLKLDINSAYIKLERMEPALRQLIVECDRISISLDEEVSQFSTTQLDKLDNLKKEVTKVCENLDINFEKNLEKSITLSECGHFLGSALITSRVIDYILDKIKGNDINEKIKTLIELGVLKKDDDKTKEQIIKASKKSRNYLNHRIDTFAEPSEALSLLGDCVILLKIFEMTQK